MTEQSPDNPAHESVQPLPVEPESIGAGSKRPAMKQSRPLPPVFTVGLILAAVATVVVVTLPNWLVSPAGVRQFLLRSIPELNGDVRVEAASIGWFTPLSIRGLGLIPADGGPAPISVEQIEGDRGLLAILMLIVGAYFYIAGGLTDDKEKGKTVIKYALGGLVLTTLSWIIINVILLALTN